jgi:short-subunit dehydrogenase
MLINGVEKKDPLGERFQDSTDEELIRLINVNSFPVTFMTRFLGPDLKTKKGAIINLTSTYSQYGSQYLPIYSAIKSFQDAFSYCVSFENEDMDILTVRHLPIKSK